MIKLVLEYLKKRQIRRDLKKSFKSLNKNRLNSITEQLFKGGKIIKAEVVAAEKRKLEFENTLLINDIKDVIKKHYSKSEEKLKKENAVLNNALVAKEVKIKKLKNKVIETVNK